MAENRLNRELDTREKTARKKSWVRPETLPTPLPEDGYEFHWVRISTRGEADAMNISLKLQEGWEPVKAAEHPEIFIGGVENERFKDNIVIGGLMLCKTPTEFVVDRNHWFNNQASSQMKSVDNNLMRENDPRMPMFNDRKTSVTFGKGT
jgi:hypothetical protein|tara:strand:- start:64 stop:513 length:450 start_codon:yes stop_codon:yes gene_type:complete